MSVIFNSPDDIVIRTPAPPTSFIQPRFGSDEYMFESDGDDDMDARNNIFELRLPVASSPLSPVASTLLNKLKSRCATHVNLLPGSFREYRREHPSMLSDTGFLLQLPHARALKFWAMVEDAGSDAAKLTNDRLRGLLVELKGKDEQYRGAVKALWAEFDERKIEKHPHTVLYYKDVGQMMQFANAQVKEILRILLGMVDAGKIKKNKDSEKVGPEYRWRIVDEEVKRKKFGESTWVWKEEKMSWDWGPPVEASGPLVEETTAGENKKRKAADEEDDDDDEAQPAPPKRRFGRGRYQPGSGEWRCGVCRWWSTGAFCTREDRHSNDCCVGKRPA